MNSVKKGELYIISAPSGAGKSSLIHEVLKRSSSADSLTELSVSATTRPPRLNDIEGQDYFFMTKEKFEDLEKKEAKTMKRLVYSPLENLFIEVGTEMMKNMSAFLSANPTSATEDMRKEIDDTIARIRKVGNEEQINKFVLNNKSWKITNYKNFELSNKSDGFYLATLSKK